MVADLDRLRDLAGPLLAGLPTAGPEATWQLFPQAADYPRVFKTPLAAEAARHYDAIWATKPVIAAKPGQTMVRMWIADPAELAEGRAEAAGFPRGYADIAPHLVDGLPWIAWKYLKEGTSLGMAYDGLVWLGDRFAWFPKPWRLLGAKKSPQGVWSD